MSDPAPSAGDAELLRTLEAAFAKHAGADAAIDIADLKKALGLRSDLLADRVLKSLDLDRDGVITKDEFLTSVRQLVFGTDREKLGFAFRLLDADGDGFVSREELHRMIALSLAEGEVSERLSQPPSQLADALLAAADTNLDGRLSLDELEVAVRRHPELLARMTRSEAIWLAPNEELLLILDGQEKKKRGARYLRIDSGAFVIIVLWIFANCAVFAWSMLHGRASETTDFAMRYGRALGACLDLDGGLVLLPIMRRMLTWVRARWLGRVVPVDDAVAFHKLVGHTLFALGITHSAAFFLAYTRGHAAQGILHALASERALTGTILLGVFAVMWLFALDVFRRSRRFELFYYTHLLYVVWLGLLLAHAPRILIFSGVAIVIFLVEQALRLGRRRLRSKIVSVWPLRSGVTRVEIEKPKGFDFGAGDYVFLRIPAIAAHEWHPFTISSAPEQPTLTFHVRSLGNWSSALRRHVEEHRAEGLEAFIDGPYGSPSGHIFESRVAVLIGAGIGVTPFASILESVVLRSATRSRPSALEKIHFVWLNRDQYSFEWFRGLLSRLEEQDEKKLLDIHLYMDGMRTGSTAFGLELAREIMHDAGRPDLLTGLRSKTHIGRPDWAGLLGTIAEQHAPQKVDVFFCGPHGLAQALAPICERLKMGFREERF